MSFLLPLVVLMIVFVLLLRRFGGPGGAIAFGRSRGKLFMREQVGVTFADVAGIDEAVEEVKEIVEFLKNPEKFRALGRRIPRGVLLVGPPGYRQDAAGQSDRRRSRGAPARSVFPGPISWKCSWSWRCQSPRHVPAGSASQ